MMGGYWRKVWAIARKDLLIELRSRDVLSSAIVFTLLVLLIFNFALDLTGDTVRAVAPGILWVTFIFAGMLTLGRTFARERERGALQGLLLAPLDRGALFLAKLVVNLVLLALVEIIAAPAFGALYDLPLRPGPLLLVIVLGTVGFAAVAFTAPMITGTSTGKSRSGRSASRARVFAATAAKSVPTAAKPTVPSTITSRSGPGRSGRS
jgi:heme exporter protein B